MVQCKHYARSGKAVGFAEVANYRDVMDQYGLRRYLLITSTLPTEDLREKFEGTSRKGDYVALAWSKGDLTAVSYIVYLGFPTYVSRPNIYGSDVFSWVLRQVYAADRSYNAFPSGHTFYTCISSLFLWQWQSQQRLLWMVLCLLIILSTLFTGQHHVLDLLSGLILALISVQVARWIEALRL